MSDHHDSRAEDEIAGALTAATVFAIVATVTLLVRGLIEVFKVYQEHGDDVVLKRLLKIYLGSWVFVLLLGVDNRGADAFWTALFGTFIYIGVVVIWGFRLSQSPKAAGPVGELDTYMAPFADVPLLTSATPLTPEILALPSPVPANTVAPAG